MWTWSSDSLPWVFVRDGKNRESVEKPGIAVGFFFTMGSKFGGGTGVVDSPLGAPKKKLALAVCDREGADGVTTSGSAMTGVSAVA